jgi:anti-sigma B factor antagonist
MHLTLESQLISGVAVIRCRGRIVVGNELSLLQQEVEKHRLETLKYVLDLGEVTYLDSGGLGALVRLMGILRAHRGDLKLCRVSSFVHDVLKATNLLSVFTVFPTEREGLASFAQRPAPREGPASSANSTILCIDPSRDLLSYISAVLQRAGFEVRTSCHFADASTLLGVVRPSAVICGPGVASTGPAFEKFRRLDSRIRFLMLPSDFHTSHASDAGIVLVNQLQELLQA